MSRNNLFRKSLFITRKGDIVPTNYIEKYKHIAKHSLERTKNKNKKNYEVSFCSSENLLHTVNLGNLVRLSRP